jgi:ribosome-binding factor A
MPREYGRNLRVADQLQRKLAALLQREVELTGTGLLTISTVDVSPDLTQASVYVSCLGADVRKVEIIEALNKLAGRYRRQLSRELTMRSVPRIRFVYDDSVERGSRLTSLINSLKDGRNGD